MGDTSGGSNRPSSLTSILPPKAQAKQSLLTPPATHGCLSVTQWMALSSLLQGLLPETVLLFSKKKMHRSLPAWLCLSHHPKEKPHWGAGQAAPPTAGRCPSKAHLGGRPACEDTRLCHTAPAWAGSPPGHPGPLFSPWSEAACEPRQAGGAFDSHYLRRG